MIRIHDAKNIHGESENLEIDSSQDIDIDAKGLTLFPGLIDPHVHFRTPGMEYKEDWRTAAKAAIAGGYTTVFDMPNTIPPTITENLLSEKKQLIDSQLKEINIPLRYELFFGADKNHLNEIPKIANSAIGIKVFMGCSTGNLVIDDDESLHAVFELAAKNNLLVAVHAEDEQRIKQRKKPAANYAEHSEIRDVETAVIAVEKALSLNEKYGTKLYVLHASSKDEIELIRRAKAKGRNVYAETTPHHLFLDTESYTQLKGRAVVNPPLRTIENRHAVMQAILDGTIDTIGSDHAPHTPAEKDLAYGQCPSGMPGIETTLALLLEAYHSGILSLHKILELTVLNPRKIFNLTPNHDVILVDLHEQKIVTENTLHTKCKWSAFAGKVLRGWPVYTILRGSCFDLRKL